ncbi:hypothetical protein [Streptomyces sp. NPDC096351]|uniref:hypothetical protein n=1 Tax=Streptomyces sp. NPDC096351 TaxID=3366087 RepID=UPI00381C9D3C
MESYRLTWAKDGHDVRLESAVTYGKTAAEDYKARKAKEAGVTDVQIVPVKPGQ